MSLDGQSRSNFAAAGAPSPSNAKLRSMERTYCESVDILWIHVKIPARTRMSSLSLSTPTKDQVEHVVDFVTYFCLHDSKGTLLLSQIKRARNFHGFTKKEEKISTSNEVIHVRAFRGKKPVNLIL